MGFFWILDGLRNTANGGLMKNVVCPAAGQTACFRIGDSTLDKSEAVIFQEGFDVPHFSGREIIQNDNLIPLAQ
jgi:hypothetical protein